MQTLIHSGDRLLVKDPTGDAEDVNLADMDSRSEAGDRYARG